MKPNEARTDDEWPSAEGLRHSEWKSLVVPAEYPLEEGEEQGGETKIETSSHGRWLSRQPPVYTSLGPLAEEPKSAELNATDMLSERVIPLLRYLDRRMMKYVKPSIAGFYIELVRSKTRTKVAASVEVA
ncbi:hypothetical protein AXG93_150s1240 [Marchantia polymorpha subsp. ruderalis]|uniref:Uncharacterized protein n=1 Tax=Marchantia polymorpha subsp. ruderalis TaxID=1480154 RepID=A0A176WDZ5_MARPO|nr:hypothetical protein AXG93_150s1240 [Marchantia polymorpha subsp. ruderalis]